MAITNTSHAPATMSEELAKLDGKLLIAKAQSSFMEIISGTNKGIDKIAVTALLALAFTAKIDIKDKIAAKPTVPKMRVVIYNLTLAFCKGPKPKNKPYTKTVMVVRANMNKMV